MYTHLEAELVRARLQEARDWAATQSVIRRLRAAPQPMRVVVGLGLVKLGRWLAGPVDERRPKPRHATA